MKSLIFAVNSVLYDRNVEKREVEGFFASCSSTPIVRAGEKKEEKVAI